MKIKINDIEYSLPASLLDITLWQRICFDKEYGKDLREKLKAIRDSKDSLTQELDFTEYLLDLACKTLSFYGDIPLEVVQNTDAGAVLEVYHQVMTAMSEEVDFSDHDFCLVQNIHWKDQQWVIQPPELKNNSAMTFGEFIDAKQIVQDLYEVGEQKWTALLALCCIFFRRKGEQYIEELSGVDEPRYELLKTLPLEYALHVGFFLNACQLSYQKDFRSSGQRKANPEGMYAST